MADIARRMVFEVEPAGRFPLPVPPFTLAGETRRPDGHKLLTLRQAAGRFGLPPARLAMAWEHAWGQSILGPSRRFVGIRVTLLLAA